MHSMPLTFLRHFSFLHFLIYVIFFCLYICAFEYVNQIGWRRKRGVRKGVYIYMTFDGKAVMESDLPLTVEELVANYKSIRHLNEELCAFIDNIRVECDSIAESSPCAAQALRDLFLNFSQGKPAVASFLNANDPHSSSAANGSTSSVCTGSGVVLEGVVVKNQKGNEMSHSAAGGAKKSRFLRFVEEATRDYKEECGVLRLKMMAMESDQKLLLQARKNLREQEKKYGTCMSALNDCRNDLALSRSQCTFLLGVLKNGESTVTASTMKNVIEQVGECMLVENGGCGGPTVTVESTAAEVDSVHSLAVRLVEAEIGLQESQAAVKSLGTKVERLLYGNDQLKARLETLAEERDALKSHNTQLEGQLNRLLLLFHDDAEARRGMQGTEEASSVVTCRAEEGPERDELKERLQRLSCDNRALQNTLLQLQRQINDSELRAEELYSEGGGEVLVLEEEVARLREALREKQFELQRTHHDWEKAATRWELLDKVHRTVIYHVSMRLMHDVARRFLPRSQEDTSPKALAAVSEDNKENSSDLALSDDTAVAVAVSSSRNSGNDNRVKELLSLLESKDSEHRLALRQWQHVNQELRSALASLQKDLKQKEGHIKVLEREKRSSDIHNSTCLEGVASGGHGDCGGDDLLNTQPKDLEQMSGLRWKEIQKENETLLQRVAAMQKENSSLNVLLEDSRARCTSLERELAKRVGAVSRQIVGGAALTDTIPIRNLQRILHDVLQENLVLVARVKELESR
ncbi:hypothetical protein ECC02_003570 [Trypanosoma cruzi]|uniref:Uncharacterized protein n=1 Tax=Trypanosoma cruzi TaxID=5693 RepID=A0A7J6Y9N9_TRYCR|nr:hypothetical protein ECC02_003570 [Trypanosoma cruzi]